VTAAPCAPALRPQEPLCRPPLYRDIGRVEEDTMDGLIYLVGLIVIVMFILSLFGLR